jgi:hypothetical protein
MYVVYEHEIDVDDGDVHSMCCYSDVREAMQGYNDALNRNVINGILLPEAAVALIRVHGRVRMRPRVTYTDPAISGGIFNEIILRIESKFEVIRCTEGNAMRFCIEEFPL